MAAIAAASCLSRTRRPRTLEVELEVRAASCGGATWSSAASSRACPTDASRSARRRPADLRPARGRGARGSRSVDARTPPENRARRTAARPARARRGAGGRAGGEGGDPRLMPGRVVEVAVAAGDRGRSELAPARARSDEDAERDPLRSRRPRHPGGRGSREGGRGGALLAVVRQEADTGVRPDEDGVVPQDAGGVVRKDAAGRRTGSPGAVLPDPPRRPGFNNPYYYPIIRQKAG